MQLAMEERDLQKMATLSQQDTLRDELQAQIEKVTKVQNVKIITVISVHVKDFPGVTF